MRAEKAGAKYERDRPARAEKICPDFAHSRENQGEDNDGTVCTLVGLLGVSVLMTSLVDLEPNDGCDGDASDEGYI